MEQQIDVSLCLFSTLSLKSINLKKCFNINLKEEDIEKCKGHIIKKQTTLGQVNHKKNNYADIIQGGKKYSHTWGSSIRSPNVKSHFHFFKDFIYLFLERGKERERNISVWLPLHAPNWGPGSQPRHVPWLGIEPATLWFTGQHSIHWATPARAKSHFQMTLKGPQN